MPQYQKDYTDDFKKDVKTIKSDFELQKRLTTKIEEIVENPYHYKPLRNVLKNKRRVHIGSFVLIFEILEEDKIVVFNTFKHHDDAY